MNRKKLFWMVVLLLMVLFSVPVSAKESSLNKQGNIQGFNEQIRNMQTDYVYLENEIFKLMEECN